MVVAVGGDSMDVGGVGSVGSVQFEPSKAAVMSA